MSDSSQFRLLRERRFLPFFAAQACGAFNDNLFKNVLVILVTYQATRWSSVRPELLANILVEGGEKAREVARATLDDVRRAMHLRPQ